MFVKSLKMMHCTVDLLFDWFGISCMTTDNFCFYLQKRLIQTSQTGFFRVLDETKESGDNRRKSTKQKQNFPPERNWRENRHLKRGLEGERES
jgi:hypothetical protein